MLGLTLFMGYDLASFAYHEYNYPYSWGKLMISAVVVIAILFSLWALVSYLFVPAERLANSTVPYPATARAVFGNTGRIIIGIVVLAGCCASVNALLRAVSRMVVSMAEQGLLPAFIIGNPKRTLVPLILFSLAVGAMMALGMAGEPETEIYARSGLYFWLVTYAGVSISMLSVHRGPLERAKLKSSLFAVIGFIVFVFSVCVLVWTDPERAELVQFMLASAAVSTLFSLVWWGIARKKCNFSKSYGTP